MQPSLPAAFRQSQLHLPHVRLLWHCNVTQRDHYVHQHHGQELWQLCAVGVLHTAHPAQGSRQAAGQSAGNGDSLLHSELSDFSLIGPLISLPVYLRLQIVLRSSDYPEATH